MHDFRMPRQLQNAEKLQQALKTKPEAYWLKRGERMALSLFHSMAESVPAYRDFLNRQHLNHRDILTISDFKERVPVIDKNNYLRQYPLKDLCWGGEFSDKRWVLSVTSGSTGEPFYFPRTELQDEYYALTAELYMRENFQIQNKSTLYIDAFAMGAWIGGIFTYEAISRVAARGYKLSIITPGVNKAEVINNVRKLAPEFDQVIIGCYPPIMKDIIDLGRAEGLDWSSYNVKIIFSAEGFSERFRDYIIDKAALTNPFVDSLNHYGTVDLGTMSHETPTTIMIRRQAVNNQSLFNTIFGEVNKQPTFTQYIPEMFYFESINKSVLCSSYSGLPLVRYDLHDNGGVITLRQVEKAYTDNGMILDTELDRAGLKHMAWQLPFVYLYERSDFSVTFLGAQIYPEEVRQALLEDPVENLVSGRFVMEVIQAKNMESTLVINVELMKGVERNAAISRKVKGVIAKTLLATNTEYASSQASAGRKALPKVVLWPNGHPLYFHGNGKQRWVKRA